MSQESPKPKSDLENYADLLSSLCERLPHKTKREDSKEPKSGSEGARRYRVV